MDDRTHFTLQQATLANAFDRETFGTQGAKTGRSVVELESARDAAAFGLASLKTEIALISRGFAFVACFENRFGPPNAGLHALHFAAVLRNALRIVVRGAVWRKHSLYAKPLI